MAQARSGDDADIFEEELGNILEFRSNENDSDGIHCNQTDVQGSGDDDDEPAKSRGQTKTMWMHQ